MDLDWFLTKHVSLVFLLFVVNKRGSLRFWNTCYSLGSVIQVHNWHLRVHSIFWWVAMPFQWSCSTRHKWAKKVRLSQSILPVATSPNRQFRSNGLLHKRGNSRSPDIPAEVRLTGGQGGQSWVLWHSCHLKWKSQLNHLDSGILLV